MARIATAARFAPDTRKTLSRDRRDFHHGLLTLISTVATVVKNMDGLSRTVKRISL